VKECSSFDQIISWADISSCYYKSLRSLFLISVFKHLTLICPCKTPRR